MALLAAYLVNKEAGETLADYLADRVFADAVGSSVDPDPKDVEGLMHMPRSLRMRSQ